MSGKKTYAPDPKPAKGGTAKGRPTKIKKPKGKKK